jgi:Lipase (class 3)
VRGDVIAAMKAILCALGTMLGLGGCASFKQDSHEVLVRDPALGHYGEPLDAGTYAKSQWVYAAMSDAVYEEARLRSFQDRNKPLPDDPLAQQVEACGGQLPPQVPPEWQIWKDFPSDHLSQEMRRKGLFLVVMERTTAPREIVVVFEGTNFTELPDWGANLRWFLRFVPGFEDQYTLTARQVSKEFFDRIRAHPQHYRVSEDDPVLRGPQGEAIRIIATGHSLGGGLAQHFAYTFHQATPAHTGPRVSEVFAFDPSPVTGWFSADDPPRTHNASGLVIRRIFEHGEVLAYLRLLTSRLAVSAENPAIWEYRYNFDSRANIVRNHSMRSLACGLARAAADSH